MSINLSVVFSVGFSSMLQSRFCAVKNYAAKNMLNLRDIT